MKTQNNSQNKGNEISPLSFSFISPFLNLSLYNKFYSKLNQVNTEENLNIETVSNKYLDSSILKTSTINITKYSHDLNSLSSICKNKRNIVLSSKSVTVDPIEMEDNNTDNTNNTSFVKSKELKYFDRIDMLTPIKSKANIKLLNNINKQSKIKPLSEFKEATYFVSVESGLSGDKHQNKLLQYLKSISQFDREVALSQSLVYNFNSSKKKILQNISYILDNTFYKLGCIISKPIFDITPNKIVIRLFFVRLFNLRKLYKSYRRNRLNYIQNFERINKSLEYLCIFLSKILNIPVELELTKLKYVWKESHILAKVIGRCSNNKKRRVSFRRILDKLLNRAVIKNPTKMISKPRFSIVPSFITGLKVRLGGRLLTQQVVPKQTVKSMQKGSLARCKADIVRISRFTAKNKRGSFSITVSMGHGFF